MNKTLSDFGKKCYNDMKRLFTSKTSRKVESDEYIPKDGDICSVDQIYVFITNGKFNKSNELYGYCGISHSKNRLRLSIPEEPWAIRFEPAKQWEIDKLFDVMEAEGFRWNKEEKKVEQVRWRAEEGESYYFVNEKDNIEEKVDIYEEENTLHFLTKNYFKTREEALKYLKEVRSKLKRFSDKSETNKELKELYKNSSDEVKRILESKFTIEELAPNFIPQKGDICVGKDGYIFMVSDKEFYTQVDCRQSTQEEKDYFFKKMRGYGYQWDEEKKNLERKYI